MRQALINRLVSFGVVVALLAACTPPPPPPPILSKQAPVALRAMQIRTFETANKRWLVQAVIATMQDLGYTVEKIDYASGTISAAKLIQLRLTAVVYPHGPAQMSVRANAMVKLGAASSQVDDPIFYQTLFFEPLSKALFLAPLLVDDDPSAPPPAMPPAPPIAKPPVSTTAPSKT
jgi:hypothetical protein